MAKLDLDHHDQFQLSTHLDAWEQLKRFTDARIALGRAGCSIPTQPMLDFQLSHAQARDAVFQALDVHDLSERFRQHHLNTITVQSQATDKEVFLKRPDLGRLLDLESKEKLEVFKKLNLQSYDVCIVIGDGLSARAIDENAYAMVMALKDQFQQLNWTLAPIVIATGSRVALGDQVAELLDTPMLIMMIGERPGLSSPDSMGIYYTWKAKTGTLDAARNCISNIRPAGQPVPIATQRLIQLMTSSKSLGYSGVNLKDEYETPTIEQETKRTLLF